MIGDRPGAFVVVLWRRFLALPELNVALFSLLLNFEWEMLQAPFFVDMPQTPHWDAVLFCARATLGDVAIAVVSYWVVAALAASGRAWILSPERRHVAGFVLIGVVIWFAVRGGRSGGTRPEPTVGGKTPEDILKDRFAKGEIDEKDYRARMDALRDRE